MSMMMIMMMMMIMTICTQHLDVLIYDVFFTILLAYFAPRSNIVNQPIFFYQKKEREINFVPSFSIGHVCIDSHVVNGQSL